MQTLPNTFGSTTDANDGAGGFADRRPYLREAMEWYALESFVIGGLIFASRKTRDVLTQTRPAGS